ncbi:hypothetical protein JW935_20900 [candidate division KSB1 bacterium]|nr:hypothetical protein [candidate division KSB1 bacterium]
MKSILKIFVCLPYVFLYGQETPGAGDKTSSIKRSGQDTVVLNVYKNPEPAKHHFILTTAPDPFGSNQIIRFFIGQPADVKITVHTISGSDVRQLYSGHLPAGYYSTVWQGDNKNDQPVPSGIYCCTLEADGIKFYTQSLAVLK